MTSPRLKFLGVGTAEKLILWQCVSVLIDRVNANIQREKQRVRSDEARRAKDTISLRVFDDNRRQVVNILRWCKDRSKDRLSRSSFEDLLTETDYESMMIHFVKCLNNSQINKHRQRF